MITERVGQFLTRHAALTPGDTLIVGVSGGADSLCLLHALAVVCQKYGIALHVAHFDHMLRGADSTADAAFVAQVAATLALPITVERADIAAAARSASANLHAVGRLLRYRFFARLAAQISARAVAVAHTADDQSETVLMHVLRGAGTTGLRGILPIADLAWGMFDDDELAADQHEQPETQNPKPETPEIQHLPLLRPLLTTTRAEVEAYCIAHGLAWREDATNRDTRYTRNHLRHELLPAIRAAYPHADAALTRTAAICADDADFIEQSLDALWPTLARTLLGAVRLDSATWRALHPALQRAAIRRGYALLVRGETLPWERVEATRALIGTVGKRLELPGGVRMMTHYDGATLYGPGQHESPYAPQLAAEMLALKLPARVLLEQGWELHAACAAPVPAAAHRWEVYLDAAVAERLAVRCRQRGDRLRPAGGRGSRRLQDVFVDAKIPREARDRWPLIATPDRIVWVPGLRAAEGFLAQPTAARAIHIWITSPSVLSNADAMVKE